LISHRSPEYFLEVEFRMICRKVIQVDLFVLFAKSLDSRAFVPACSINPKVDALVLASANKVR
jgi:hypothetical protein